MKRNPMPAPLPYFQSTHSSVDDNSNNGVSKFLTSDSEHSETTLRSVADSTHNLTFSSVDELTGNRHTSSSNKYFSCEEDSGCLWIGATLFNCLFSEKDPRSDEILRQRR